jgi:hypothetical protein
LSIILVTSMPTGCLPQLAFVPSLEKERERETGRTRCDEPWDPVSELHVNARIGALVLREEQRVNEAPPADGELDTYCSNTACQQRRRVGKGQSEREGERGPTSAPER